jgi:hypothetical protein
MNLFLGAVTSEGAEYSESSRYFIEAYEYGHVPGRSLFTLHGIDAIGKLRRYNFPMTIHYNVYTEAEANIYTILGVVMSAIGGTLSYKSRSYLLTTLYPMVTIAAGTSGLQVMQELMSYVDDVVQFIGLDAYIIYPQTTDKPDYTYKFPS